MAKFPVENSRVFITGGAGLVGSYITEKLLPLNPGKIYIVDNMVRGNHQNMQSFISNPIVEFIEGDIRDKDLLESIMSKTDYCFHLAALRINRCAENQQEAFEVMVESTFRIIDLAKKYGVKKIVYSSTASVYGQAKNFPTSETENPYDNKTIYGGAKLLGEQLLRSYHDMFGLDYVALRFFNVYGPRMDTDGKYTEVMIRWLDCIRDGRQPLIYGDGSSSADYVYVEDVADASVKALTSNITDEIINVGSGRETSLKQLLELTIKINKSPLNPQYMPENKVNPVHRRLADISKANKMLGYVPQVSLEKGLEKLSEWYFANILQSRKKL